MLRQRRLLRMHHWLTMASPPLGAIKRIVLRTNEYWSTVNFGSCSTIPLKDFRTKSIILFPLYVFIILMYPIWTIYLLYPSHRGYNSFVNTFVTPINNDLGPKEHGDIWSVQNSKSFELSLSVRPSVVNTIAYERNGIQTLHIGCVYFGRAMSVHRL